MHTNYKSKNNTSRWGEDLVPTTWVLVGLRQMHRHLVFDCKMHPGNYIVPSKIVSRNDCSATNCKRFDCFYDHSNTSLLFRATNHAPNPLFTAPLYAYPNLCNVVKD